MSTEPQRLSQIEAFCGAVRTLGGNEQTSVAVAENGRRLVATMHITEDESGD